MANESRPSLKQRLQAAYKTFVGAELKSADMGDWLSSGLPGNVYSSGRTGRMHWVPGTAVNWDRVTGDLWMCPAVQACLNWICRNFPQAPPIVEQQDKKGEWSPVASHPLIDLLNKPNPIYDGSVLFQGLILSLETNGNGYAIIERTNGGVPAELWYAPHHMVTPYTEAGHDPRIIDYYIYRLGPQYIRVPPSDMLHLKYGIDPLDLRFGLAPLASSARDVNALQQAGNYRPTILRNFGTVGAVISGKTGESRFDMDVEGIKDRWDSRTRGDMAGSAVISEAPLDVVFPKTSPQDMALTTIEDRPEADICALIGIPIMVTGLHGGRESKTYANMREARESAWEEKLIPLGSMLACQIGGRFLPEFSGTSDPVATQKYLATTRMAFDYRDIRPLQPDLDALHARALKDWLANLLTLGEWCQVVGRPDPAPKLADMRYSDLGGQPQQLNERGAQQSSLQETQTPEPKGMPLSDVMPADFAEHMREELKRLAVADYEPVGAVVMNGNGVH